MHPNEAPSTELGGRRSELKPSTFEKNAERMGYPEFCRQHLFIGTGVIEAGRQNRDPLPAEAVGPVPDRARPERNSGSPLLPIHGRFEDYW